MLFPFTDALNIWFMNGINLLGGITTLGKYLFEDGNEFVIISVVTQIPLELSDQTSGYLRSRLSALRAFLRFFRWLRKRCSR